MIELHDGTHARVPFLHRLEFAAGRLARLGEDVHEEARAAAQQAMATQDEDRDQLPRR